MDFRDVSMAVKMRLLMTFCFPPLVVLTAWAFTSFILMGSLRPACQPCWITAGRKGFTAAFHCSSTSPLPPTPHFPPIITVHVPAGVCIHYMQCQRSVNTSNMAVFMKCSSKGEKGSDVTHLQADKRQQPSFQVLALAGTRVWIMSR